MTYTIVLILHLFCATIFLGFVFVDVIVLPAIKKVLDEDTHKKVMESISKRARKIYPISVLILFLTGGFMLSKYINSSAGVFNTPLQILLMIKVFLAFLIIAGIVYSLISKLLKKQPYPIMKHFHKFVLVTGIFIIILAKLMFTV